MLISSVVRDMAKNYGCSVREIAEQECCKKEVGECTVTYHFTDGSTIASYKTPEDE